MIERNNTSVPRNQSEKPSKTPRFPTSPKKEMQSTGSQRRPSSDPILHIRASPLLPTIPQGGRPPLEKDLTPFHQISTSRSLLIPSKTS